MTFPVARSLLLIILSASLTGCLVGPGAPALGHSSVQSDGAAVVAILGESGLNAYHTDFHVSEPQGERYRALAGLLDAQVLRLSSEEDLDVARSEDEAQLESLQRGVLYWISGTRVFFISFANQTEPLALTNDEPLSANPHGTGVASVVARTSPHAAIIHIHTHQTGHAESIPPREGRVVLSESLVAAAGWTARQVWIDVVSMSFAIPASAPDGGPLTRSLQEFSSATHAMRASGKLVVAGAGNQPPPSIVAPVAGPPWVISVGMADWSENGEGADSSKVPDYLANTSMTVAHRHSRNGTDTGGGTSISAPALAARISNIITRLRAAADPEITPAWQQAHGPFVPAGALGPGSAPIGAVEVRAALNITARYWTPDEWTPKEDSSLIFTVGNASLPVNPILPAVQMGWGYVDADEESAAYELLKKYALTGDRSLLENPPEKGANARFMEDWYAARSAYWDAKTRS